MLTWWDDLAQMHHGMICAALAVSYFIYLLIRRATSRFGLRSTNPSYLKVGIRDVIKVRKFRRSFDSPSTVLPPLSPNHLHYSPYLPPLSPYTSHYSHPYTYTSLSLFSPLLEPQTRPPIPLALGKCLESPLQWPRILGREPALYVHHAPHGVERECQVRAR